jgi:hypothetical protein
MNTGLRLSGTHSVLPIFCFTTFYPTFLSSKSTKKESVFEKVSRFGISYILKESNTVYLREFPFSTACRAASSISSLGS